MTLLLLIKWLWVNNVEENLAGVMLPLINSAEVCLIFNSWILTTLLCCYPKGGGVMMITLWLTSNFLSSFQTLLSWHARVYHFSWELAFSSVWKQQKHCWELNFMSKVEMIACFLSWRILYLFCVLDSDPSLSVLKSRFGIQFSTQIYTTGIQKPIIQQLYHFWLFAQGN